MHEQEDELLFIHSGSGLGVVGDQRRNVSAGTTLYIPQRTWHGVESEGDKLEILWVASPRHFAETLRATLATIVTLLALATGSLSSIVIALSVLLIAVAIFLATLGGIGVRALASRLASRSS